PVSCQLAGSTTRGASVKNWLPLAAWRIAFHAAAPRPAASPAVAITSGRRGRPARAMSPAAATADSTAPYVMVDQDSISASLLPRLSPLLYDVTMVSLALGGWAEGRDPADPDRARTVLFVCEHGASRSRLAAVWFTLVAPPGWRATSAS